MKSQRKKMPRVHSLKGIDERVEIRRAATPPNTGKMHYITPGSRNPRKVTR